MTVDQQVLEPPTVTAPPAALAHGRLPHVNLLPPEIAERARLRRMQLGLGGGLLTAVGVVALLYAGGVGSVREAEDELAAVTGQNAALQQEVTGFADVEVVHAAADAAQVLLSQALGQEVRYSQLLDDLTLTVPEHVWLREVTFAQTAPTQAATSQAAQGLGQEGVGTVSFTGVGHSHDDVAAWLESLTAEKGYTQPYFTGATSSTTDGRRVVTFTSTATLTADALSGRYSAPSGG